ncbi:MAG TPA: sigma-54 dependent transcriptional regulator [Gemmatimonadales bacterium]|nr:sigma-54 dependent transcriptional regulator [Gemmatimonadales bacterium]
MATILCVDDEPSVGVVLEDTLQRMGHEPLLARSADEALAVLGRTPVDLIISDYRMPKTTGLDLLALLKAQGYDVPLIMLTGYASIEHAVIAIKSGAIDYLTKPVVPEALEIAVGQALELARLRAENEAFREEVGRYHAAREIVGESEALRRVLQTIAAAAPTRATVLLEGESGTGKELFAQALHDQSPRRDRPMITINCAAMPEGLVESSLFGHEKGAFTGATARSAGAFERAHRSTLLLDEISEMRLDLQSKLLRVIETSEFDRVGGQSTISVDVRLIATTNRNLQSAVAAGTFRSDLYYRLAVMPIHTPALRERLDDVPLLARYFARRTAKELGIPAPTITADAVKLLQRHGWPGNIRELANIVERAVILNRGRSLGPEAFDLRLHAGAPALVDEVVPPPAATAPAASAPAASRAAEEADVPRDLYNLDAVEAIMIERALRATGGNRTRAAALLGISERTLRNKLNVPQGAP